MGGSGQSSFKLNLCMRKPEPGAWASIETSQKPDPQASQLRVAAESLESDTGSSRLCAQVFPLLHPQNPSSTHLGEPHLGKASHRVAGLQLAGLVE